MSLVEGFERALLGALSPAGRRGRLLILTYHRVLAAVDPLMSDEPDAAGFASQMDVLKRYCTVLALPDAVARLKAGTLPARAASITFDDGYANNLDVALPILEQRGLTGTVFIAVEAIQRGIMWNDLVIEGVRAAGDTLDLSALDKPSRSLAGVDRFALISELLMQLKYLPLERRWDLALRFHRDNSHRDPPRLMLREEQVAELARRGHDVGAHTIKHPILKELQAANAREEIAASGRWLHDVLGAAPRSFAYPNGRPGRDYDASHAAMVKEAGFELAVSTAWGCATGASDPYQLPRCTSWELSSRWFALRLARHYATA
jgi:peptidoglycan/xylan/chitin deacetylase (PgdA/CDA1 family)